MVLKREEKERLVAELHEKFKEVRAVILTDFTGLDVAQLSRLRRQLQERGMEYRVVKNTLLRRASQKTALEALAEHFVGPNAVVLSYEDPVLPAKILVDFAKEEPELQIKAGFVEGRVLEPKDVKALATLPPREVLIGQMVGLLKAPLAMLVGVLQAPMRELVGVLQAIKEGKSE
ncbi:MAG: 50S ribosomal protein L10 [Deltaproteobacteria bacterium]|nr:MAG: 50S ribosomal protein L10 [Deltaproteobacteria bacterium]RLB03459.1 MAG: 50S ribosomal protein L10 [Deltaproteobacteria bacterium]